VRREACPPRLVFLCYTMVKRKAEGNHRAEPPPPPPQDDSSESDVCEIVSPPRSSNPSRPPSVGFSSAPDPHPQPRAPAGLFSMMSGIPAAGFGLSAAGQGAHFGYHQPVQAPNGFNPLYAAPQLLTPQAGVQGDLFPGAPRSLSAGASSGDGASNGASIVGEFFSLKIQVMGSGNTTGMYCMCFMMTRHTEYLPLDLYA